LSSDTTTDTALQIAANGTDKRGIAIVNAQDGSIHVLYAGTEVIPNGVDSFSIGFWQVEPRSALPVEPVRGADVLRVSATPGEWCMFWWNGSTYKLYVPPID
jgi:hypothetical protein